MRPLADILRSLSIEAKQQGREWMALCPSPDHDDHKPSWSIRDEPGHAKHGFHGCWSCGFKGGLVGLVMAVRGCSMGEAVAYLGKDAVEDAPEHVRLELERVHTRGAAFVMPVGVTIEPMSKWPMNVAGYAASRGLISGQVDTWGIGYALGGKLAGRIVIPKRDAAGVLRGYTARTFLKSEKKRYLEPLEMEGADMSCLFGEAQWVDARGGAVVVTEGALNALAYARVCDHAVAALSGTKMANVHAAMKLARFARVYVATDADRAGDDAAEAIISLLERRTECIRLRLPNKVDAVDLGDEQLARTMEAMR